jgi:cytochrome c-type biogenesis protein CcmE
MTTFALKRKNWSRKRKRLATIAGLAVVLGLATTLVLTALRDQIVFFYSPVDLVARSVLPGTAIRLGGLVEGGSWFRTDEIKAFSITDGHARIQARYSGILPDLFREGQGVVAEGTMQEDGTFLATSVLAKHDENYMPKEVIEAFKDNGEWYVDAQRTPSDRGSDHRRSPSVRRHHRESIASPHAG